MLTSVGVMLLAAAAAANNPVDAVRACAPEKNDGVRLACYDRAIAALDLPAPTAQAPAPTPPPAKPPAVDEFGMTDELRRKRSPDQAKANPDIPEKLRAQVVSVQRTPLGTRRVELDNGQVWIETERNQMFLVKAGDPVTIKPGVLGSFFLARDAGGASRVKRIK